jgi:hypothetical protein
MKSTTVKGTPVNHVSSRGALIGAREGYASVPPATPKGMSGTVNKQFEGDQKGNRQVEQETGVKYGTSYNSNLGNPDEAVRVRADHRYGVIPVNGGQDMNASSSNGNGVILDHMSRDKGYQPKDAHTMDSPVHDDAPFFDTRTIKQENAAHMGGNTAPGLIEDDLVRAGGVMSRED